VRFESEVIAEKLLPAIRSIVSTNLKEDYGLKQEEIANKLDITQAAVSKYINGGRADEKIVEKLSSDPQTKFLLEDVAGKAAKNEDYSEELSDILRTVRDKGLMKEEFEDVKKL